MRSVFFFLIFFLVSTTSVLAQPSVLGTEVFNSGSFTNYNLVTYGKLRQYRGISNVNGSYDWLFSEGTAASPNYANKWNPYTIGLFIPSFDSILDPSIIPASARYNSGGGGANGKAANFVSGRYYTFNIGDNGASQNNFMAIWETTYNPTVISTVTRSPVTVCNGGSNADVYLLASGNLNPGELVYLRYSSTANFATSSLVEATFIGVNGKASIPIPSSGTIYYYIFTSKLPLSRLAPGGTVSQINCDLSTLTMNNNGGANYFFTVQPGTVPSSLSFSPTTACVGVSTTFTATSTNGNEYAWDFGNVLSSYTTSNTINHTFSITGNQSVIMRARNSSGCEQSVTNIISVSPVPDSKTVEPQN